MPPPKIIAGVASKALPDNKFAVNTLVPTDSPLFVLEALDLAKRVVPGLQEGKGSMKFINLENIIKEL